MVFSSVVFMFVFLPLVLSCYFLIKKEIRNFFLLIVSLVFYAWGEPRAIVIMLASILLNYICGLLIDYIRKYESKLLNRMCLCITVVGNLSLLFYFKYFDFFITIINEIFNKHIALRNIALPIGISFFTFQGMSYVLDLYLGNVKVQKNLMKLALYVSLFPQLIAGPIVRYKDVNDQIDHRESNLENITEGIRRFSIGLAKKAIIANELGLVADSIFSVAPMNNSMSITWLGAICYSFQIYFDFSGYSDMAIGIGKILGFTFLENFNYPYISKSLTEFWRRWHISLSSWFRDYLYIPLGGNRRGNVYFNLFLVFFATGLWHGAAWNFIIWGLWHGIFLIIERVFKVKGIKLNVAAPIKWVYTCLIVIIGWVMFRAVNMSEALTYIGVMLGLIKTNSLGLNIGWYLNNKVATVLVIAVIASIPWKEVLGKYIHMTELKREILYNCYCIIILIIAMGNVMTSTYNPFIYFRF